MDEIGRQIAGAVAVVMMETAGDNLIWRDPGDRREIEIRWSCGYRGHDHATELEAIKCMQNPQKSWAV